MGIYHTLLQRSKHPYVTVAELRRNPDLLVDRAQTMIDPRFAGGTETAIVSRYCPRELPILECGPIFGQFTKWLQEQRYRNTHALDFVDMLKYPDRRRIQFTEIDFNVERMPYADASMGSVIAWGILEHLENPYHFIRECHRVLREEGHFLLSMPNVLHIMSRLKFLRTGMFPRWNTKDNHTVIFPHGLFEKAFLRHFNLVEELYSKPDLKLYSNKDRWFLPKSVWFGNYVIFVLKKKPFVPYA